jgi:hypothetical protein
MLGRLNEGQQRCRKLTRANGRKRYAVSMTHHAASMTHSRLARQRMTQANKVRQKPLVGQITKSLSSPSRKNFPLSPQAKSAA